MSIINRIKAQRKRVEAIRRLKSKAIDNQMSYVFSGTKFDTIKIKKRHPEGAALIEDLKKLGYRVMKGSDGPTYVTLQKASKP